MSTGVLRVLVTSGVLGLLGVGTRLPLTMHADHDAVLRLAWQLTGERAEVCRRLTPEELQKIPAHMRREEECSEHGLRYRLKVVVDGAARLDEVVRAAGTRADRPLSVFHELAIAPGRHRIEVSFQRDEEPKPGERPHDDAAERLTLSDTLTAGSRQAVLVTYDAESNRLVLPVRTRP